MIVGSRNKLFTYLNIFEIFALNIKMVSIEACIAAEASVFPF